MPSYLIKNKKRKEFSFENLSLNKSYIRRPFLFSDACIYRIFIGKQRTVKHRTFQYLQLPVLHKLLSALSQMLHHLAAHLAQPCSVFLLFRHIPQLLRVLRQVEQLFLARMETPYVLDFPSVSAHQ